jgi:iduronate 2-sulfatase
MLDAYGQKQMITPVLDKLAGTSTIFNRAYCQQAICGPTRNSFL